MRAEPAAQPTSSNSHVRTRSSSTIPFYGWFGTEARVSVALACPRINCCSPPRGMGAGDLACAALSKFCGIHKPVPGGGHWYALGMDDLSSKVALVTGASRGIGRAIALALAQAGADVGINFLRRAEEAETAAEEVRRYDRRGIIFQADVSVASDVQRLIRRVEEELGAIDVLVNNAGIANPLRIEDITEDDWDETITVNLKSCFLATQAALPGMRARHWGRIINVSSVAAQVGGVVGPHYAASKAGMIGLTRSYAQRLAKEGVTANAIAPALVETEMVTSNPNARPDHIPVGRYGLPIEVAQVAVMLALNGYITGQTINVNGGWYMN